MRHLIHVLPLALVACTGAPSRDAVAPAEIVVSLGEIETDVTGRCFATTAGPTRTEIVDELIEVVPEVRAADGNVTSPPVYRTVSRPRTVSTGPGRRFETVCPPVYTVPFVSSLQRALLIRRAYDGPITGQYDDATSLAVQMFQRPDGIDSPLLGVDAARSLGIVAVPRS